MWLLTRNAFIFGRIIHTFHHFQSVVIGVPYIVVFLRYDIRAEPSSFFLYRNDRQRERERGGGERGGEGGRERGEGMRENDRFVLKLSSLMENPNLFYKTRATGFISFLEQCLFPVLKKTVHCCGWPAWRCSAFSLQCTFVTSLLWLPSPFSLRDQSTQRWTHSPMRLERLCSSLNSFWFWQ